MSLLLDALQRASQEKRKLAEAREGGLSAEPSAPAPAAFPELTLEPVEEPPTVVVSSPDAAGDSLSLVVATPSDIEASLVPDLTPTIDCLAVELGTSLVRDNRNRKFPEEVPFQPTAVQLEPNTSKPLSQTAEGLVADAAPDVAPSQSPDTRPEPIGAVAVDATSADNKPPPTLRAEPSPRIAREILAAHQLPKRKLATKTIILISLVAVVALVNAAYFLGFFDRLLGPSDSVVGTGVAVAPPPAPDSLAAPPAPAAQAAGAGSASTLAMVAGAESVPPIVGQSSPAGAASPTPSQSNPQSSSDSAREKRHTTGAPRPQSPVLVSRPAPGNLLQSAYEALRAGRVDEARAAYRQALRDNPAERDALLGLAHLAHRAGGFDEARELYQQVLRLDPEQADAAAGLLSIASTSDPASAASRMRDLAERSPQSPVAMSTLGGMLAREGRIGEAQQAYFRAYALDPENALHAYNLAVALDRLHKYAQAREYYQRALALAEKGGTSRVAGFPGEQAKDRLEQLRGTASDASETRPVASPAR